MVCGLLPLPGKEDLGLMAHLLGPECLPLPAQLGLGLMPLPLESLPLAVQVDLGLMAQLLASDQRLAIARLRWLGGSLAGVGALAPGLLC